MTLVLVSALAPVFFTLALGWFAGARRIIDTKQTMSINLLLMNFALPASLFVAMARTPVALLRSDLVLVLALAPLMFATYALMWWLHTALFHGSRQEAAVQALTVAFPNCAAVGLSLLPAVYGPLAQSVAAIGIAVGAVTISPLTIALLEREVGSSDHSFSRAFATAFRRPVVFAPILGVLLALTGLPLPDLASRSLLLLGQGAAGIALFLTGLILASQRLRLTAAMSSGILLKNLLQPLVFYIFLTALRMPPALKAQATLLAAVPAGFFGTVFGARFGVRSADASATLLASTVLSILTLALTIFLLRSVHA